jgi:hypothetical protein
MLWDIWVKSTVFYLNQYITSFKNWCLLPVFALLFSLPNQLFSQVSASPEPITITMPDNSKLTIIGRGNARESYTETIDGYTIFRNNKGYYVYGYLDKQNNLVPGKKVAHNPDARKKCERRFIEKKLSPHLRRKKVP